MMGGEKSQKVIRVLIQMRQIPHKIRPLMQLLLMELLEKRNQLIRDPHPTHLLCLDCFPD